MSRPLLPEEAPGRVAGVDLAAANQGTAAVPGVASVDRA